MRCLACVRDAPHVELVSDDVHGDRVTLARAALEERLGYAVHDLALDDALERARTEHRIEPVERDALERGGRDLERDLAHRRPLADEPELDLDNLADLVERELVEEHDVVDTVQELGAERHAERRLDRLAHLALVALRRKLLDELAADVARHDEDRVAEAHRA